MGFCWEIDLENFFLWFTFILKWTRFYRKFYAFRRYLDSLSPLSIWAWNLLIFFLILFQHVLSYLDMLLSIFRHFLVFGNFHLYIFVWFRFTLLIYFRSILLILNKKLSIKRLWHLIDKSLTFIFILQVPFRQKFVHFISRLQIVLKAPFTV